MHLFTDTRGKSKLILLVVISAVVTLGFIYKTTDTLAADQDVEVIGKVNYDVKIRVFPENRIPQVGHWQNQSVVEIRNPGFTNPLISQVVQHDANGYAQLGPVDASIVNPGQYDIAVKGYSHLRKVYSGNTFGQNTLFFDLTTSNIELLAGDTSAVVDNYINSMDFSFSINKLYSDDIKSDLNRDGVVNSLDIGNMISNIYLTGDQ